MTFNDLIQLIKNKISLAGNETINGIKTFVSSPIVPTPSSNTAAANKKYVDDMAGRKKRTPIGAVCQWIGSVPSWALDCNGASTEYSWANYPELNTAEFKDQLDYFVSGGWCNAYDSAGFYIPDLRGVSAIGSGTNSRKYAADGVTRPAGGSVGTYSVDANSAHTHTHSHTHDKGTYRIQGVYGADQLTHSNGGIETSGAFYNAGKVFSRTGTTDAGGTSKNIGFDTDIGGWTGSSAAPNNSITSEQGGVGKGCTFAVRWIIAFE